jgi:RNA polymerase subunit RPABC4/transcription elongation factor Spt4
VAIRTYHDFVIYTDEVETDGFGRVQAFSVLVFDSPVGQGEKAERVTVPEKYDVNQRSRMLEERKLDPDVARQMELGEVLAGLLLPPHARQLFLRSLDWARGDGVRLRLRLAKELSPWPWEYLYLQRSEGERTSSGFIALDPRISIVRHQAIARPSRPFGPVEKRRILVAMATPGPHSRYPKLQNLPREQKRIRTALAQIKGISVDYLPTYRGDESDVIPGARLKDLMLALMQPADIVHFAGHGEFIKGVGPGGEQIVGQGSIILADEDNQAVPVPADRLGEVLRGKGVQLVVLGACETGRRDALHLWSSVAAPLLESGIAAVLAMQFTIYDDLAAAFMGAFYQALVAGFTVDEAVAVGRTAIRAEALNGRRDARDWGVPVLYLHTPGGRIFNPIQDEPARQAAEKRIGTLVTQQVTEVAKSGRVVGALLDEIQSTEVEIVQQVEEVKGVVIGASVVDFEGDQVKIDQTAGVVSGTMIGYQAGDSWAVLDKLLQRSYQPESAAPLPPPSEARTCPECGEPVQADWMACPFCGAELPTEPVCPQCGKPVKEGWKKCPHCGASLGGDRTCPNCHKPVEPGWKGCPFCGTPLKGG